MHCPVCAAASTRPLLEVGERAYHRCEQCEATFLDPRQRPTQAEAEALYRLHRNAVDDPAYRGFLARLVTPLLARLAPGSEGLDYGCGPGPALAAMLEEAGHRVTLYDPLFFDQPAALARRYDFVTLSEVAEHFHEPRLEFERLGQYLRPGGWLAVMTRFQTDDRRFAGWHYRRDPTHVVFYRERTFRLLAASQGWACEIPRADVALMRKRA